MKWFNTLNSRGIQKANQQMKLFDLIVLTSIIACYLINWNFLIVM